MTEKEMNQISDTLLKLEANINCGKMSPNDTAIAVHRTLDFILDIYQKGDGKKEDQLIDKIDKDLEIKRGYAMTDEEVYIVKRTYELMNKQCTLNT